MHLIWLKVGTQENTHFRIFLPYFIWFLCVLWVIILLHHQASLKLEVMNILMHIWIHWLQSVQTLKQQSRIKLWCFIHHSFQLRWGFGVGEHFPISFAEHPDGLGNTWDMQQFFCPQWFLICCPFTNTILTFLIVDTQRLLQSVHLCWRLLLLSLVFFPPLIACWEGSLQDVRSYGECQ